MNTRRRTALRAGFPLHLLGAILLGCQTTGDPPPELATGAPYLFVWAGDADNEDSDFLAVLDARRSEPTYGQVVATLPVGVRGSMPHHTEYEYPPNHILLASGWVAGRTFLIDLGDPRKPRLAGELPAVEGFAFPHSFARLPGDHVLATYQSAAEGYAPVGGQDRVVPRGRP